MSLKLWFTPDAVDISSIADEARLKQIVQVLEGMGAKREMWWCEEHERPGHRNACSARVKVAACPMVACLVLPLPTPQEADDAE